MRVGEGVMVMSKDIVEVWTGAGLRDPGRSEERSQAGTSRSKDWVKIIASPRGGRYVEENFMRSFGGPICQ